MKRMSVLKASGEYEPYSEEKIGLSLKRSGVEKKLVKLIIDQIRDKIYDGIPTSKIYSLVVKRLQQEKSHIASKYNLKQAIMQLGPSGFPFEKFVAGILAHKGYKVKVGQIVQGKCVSHEIDVIAQKENEHFMIECKYHNRPGTKSDVKVALYVHSRFLDVQNAWVEIAGHKRKFHQGWLATNTKITSDARDYAKCVDLGVISWDYPENFGLRLLIEETGLHPITCLNVFSQDEKKELIEKDFVFCRDLIDRKIDFLPADLVKKARADALEICQRHIEKR